MISLKHRNKDSTADLQALRTYFDTALHPKSMPRNLAELSVMIKNRLQKKPAKVDQQPVHKEWLKEKGMNVQPIIDHLNFKRKVEEESKEKE